MTNLDFNSIAEQTAEMMIARLDSLGLSPEEYHSDSGVLRQFASIAVNQLMGEPGLPGPDPANSIPLDERMIMQGLTLFCEGLYDALVKCAQMGIVGQLKQEMIQNLAMHVYDQAKQLMAATYGQEHTPEFQFSHEQQVDIIQKAAEGYLMAMVTEYESVNGPIIHENDVPPMPAAVPNTPQSPQSPNMPQASQQVATQSKQPLRPQGSSPHDKYAAVALLLTSLPPEQRIRILKTFNDEEKELITYYSYPQHVEQNLDLECVKAHLKKLQEALKKSGIAKTEAYKGILSLVESNPPEKLLSWVKDERPLIKRYLEVLYRRKTGQAPIAADGQSSPDPLPPRIEEILYSYLAKRLKKA